MKIFSGIKPLCIVNCLNFGHPRDSLGDFANIITHLKEKCKIYNIPIVGGNVSLYNSTGKNSIKPTPILLMMGISL
jgi:phosphoribosylformylglycinamidine synthase